jgi:hypothetical protein
MYPNVRVYVAGPIRGKNPTPANMTRNVNKAMDVWARLTEAGILAYVPHTDYFMARRNPQTFEGWETQDFMDIDFPWLRTCNIFLRLPGESHGADVEQAEAERIGMPILYSVEEVVEWVKEIYNTSSRIRASA